MTTSSDSRHVPPIQCGENHNETEIFVPGEYASAELTPTPYEATVMLEYPFLALGENRIRDFIFSGESKQITLEVTTQREKGMAFVPDINILIWVISELRERIWVRHEPRDDIVLSIARSKLLHYIGKKPGGAQHDDLATGLDRLCATKVKTNLPWAVTGGKVQSFALLERYEPNYTNPADPVWTITPPEWLVDIVHQDLLTRINPDSMKHHGIPRCIYRYARATIGDSECVAHLDPARAADRFGSDGKRAASTMRHRLKQMIEAKRTIPDYTIVAAKDGITIVPSNVVYA